jgi:hypothetical protein
MTPIETIEKEVPGMISPEENKKDATVKVVGELFGEKIFKTGPDVFARINFINAESKHLIGQMYLQGVDSKEKLEEAVNGSVYKINEILPCL